MTFVRAIELRLIRLPLVRPFRTSFGQETEKECILARVETDDAEGWGECVAGPGPGFSEEFNEGESLAAYLGANKDRVACGVSVGIPPSTEQLLEHVAGYLADGYRRVKLKIQPGLDIERVAAVREANPGATLSVDANAAYSLDDIETFRTLDRFDLLMVEQPLHQDDLVEHSKLQREIRTDICLDESIRSAADAEAAIELGSCRIVNVKQGRVGGLREAKQIHDVLLPRGVPLWCGGMLETGIGRATNLALAALPGFVLPGDTSASGRYFLEDITEPFLMDPDGTMAVPGAPGIGVDPRPDRLAQSTLRAEVLKKRVTRRGTPA